MRGNESLTPKSDARSEKENLAEVLRFADFSRPVRQNATTHRTRPTMATLTKLHADSTADLQPLAAFAFARPRRRNRVVPWLLLLAVWGIAISLLIVGAETATLIAAAGH